MSDKEKWMRDTKEKHILTEWMEIFNVLVSIGPSISVCLQYNGKSQWVDTLRAKIAKQKFEDANPKYNYKG